MPTATDLVTDLPADFAVFGQGVDTTMADLKGGTSGQILSKATNTDMDFIWTTANPGDITGVTAGTGITGGGTSGTVTVTNDMATTITTNGDLIYGTGSGTYTRRAIGSTGNVLTVAGGVPTWAAPAGGGKVLQVVQGTSNTATSINNSTYTDSTLSATITPSSASSKVLVLVSQAAKTFFSGANPSGNIKLLRGSTDIWLPLERNMEFNFTGTTSTTMNITLSMHYLDSPATTSATTYKTQQNWTSAGGNLSTQPSSTLSTIILMEIGA